MSRAEEIIASGVDAIKLGDQSRGCDLIIRALQLDPHNERAWFWLSAIVATREEQRYCLKRVLEINCDNDQAQAELDALEPGPSMLPNELITIDAPAPPEVIRLERQAARHPLLSGSGINRAAPGWLPVLLIGALILAGLVWLVLQSNLLL